MESNRLGRTYYGLLGQSSAFNSAFKVAQVCLTWFVFTNTHSATAVGLVAIVETLAVFTVSLPVGTVVDRINKGFLLLVSGLMGVAAFSILTLSSAFLAFSIIPVLVLAAVWGMSREIYRSTVLATLPDLVRPEILPRANGLFRALNSSLGSVSNALAGGLIVFLGIAAGFSFSTGAYLVSSLFAGFMILPFMARRGTPASAKAGSYRNMLSDLREGFRWLVGSKGFFLLTVSATFFNFFMAMAVTYYVIYAASGINGGSIAYGLIMASIAAGDVTGSLIPGKIDLLRHSGKLNVVLYGGATGAGILIMGLFPSFLTAIIFTFISGVSLGIAINLWLTTAHNVVPENMRGRYFALDGVLSTLGPAAIATGAVVISLAGILEDFIISGILLLCFTLVFSLMKSLWTLDGSISTASTTRIP